MSRIIKSDSDRGSMRASATVLHPLHDDFDPLADDPDAPPDPEFASIRKGKDRPNSRRAIRLTNDVNALLISELEQDTTKRQSFQAPTSAAPTATFGGGYSTPTQAHLSASLPGPQSSAGTLGRRATSSKVLAMARSIDSVSSPPGGSPGPVASPPPEVKEKESTPEPVRDPARELTRRDTNYTSPTGGSMRANGGIGRNRNNTISTVTYQVESPSSSTGDSLARLFASPPSLSSSIPTPANLPSPPTSAVSPPSELNSSGEGLGGSARRFFTLRRGGGGGGVQPPPQSDLNSEYDNYLAIAKREEFNDVAPLNFMYPSGKDAMGRTIIVMIGAHLPAKKIDLERVMLYAISVMDPVVESEYVLVYAHTNMSAENRPNFAWLRKMYTIFNRKYKKNLKQLYIIHPTVWVKMTFRLFKPFVSNKFWKKLLYVDQTADLWKYFQKDQLKLPDSILNYGAPPRKVQPMFGAPLDEVVARPENNLHNDSGSPREIPKLVDDAVKYLRERAMNVEGLFRLSGSSAQIKELKKSLDAGEDVDLSEVEDPHVVAGILKLYLRELPSPLLVNCHTSMLNVYLLPTQQQQIDCLRMIIGSLPRVHRATAMYLIPFWHQVTMNSAENRMTPANLSIVTAPNIVKNPQETMESAVQDTPGINSAVCLLIQYADQILS